MSESDTSVSAFLKKFYYLLKHSHSASSKIFILSLYYRYCNGVNLSNAKINSKIRTSFLTIFTTVGLLIENG